MSFCPECGVRNEKGTLICGNCGGHLVVTNSPPASESPNVAADDERTSEVNLTGEGGHGDDQGGFLQAGRNGTNDFVRIDSQLGRGTIKPNMMEWGIDGYHFKYEEPPRTLAKAGPVKEKVAEFRVTASEIGAPAPSPTEPCREPSTEEVQYRACDVMKTATDSEISRGEPVFTGEYPEETWKAAPEGSPLESSGAKTPVETSAEDPGQSGPGPGIPVSETEIACPFQAEPAEADPSVTAAEPQFRIIWEGKASFLGIPFGPHYQITNQAIRMIGQRYNMMSEYPLTRIHALEVRQNWLGRLCGYGDLVAIVRETGGETEIALKAIARPAEVLRILADLIGLRYNERYG